ncbi:MAG: hypothetical protein RR922_00980 [Clostridia bacterium]
MANKSEKVEIPVLRSKQSEKKQVAKITDQPTSGTQIRLFLAAFFLFVIIMGITYRYSLINSKNLELQSLKSEYKKILSDVNIANLEVESKYNVALVEDYAKQKLGMQKPEKSQIIYIDTRKKDYVEKVNSNKLTKKINEFFTNIQIRLTK